MDFSSFFIDRPIFAAVLSIVIFAAGLIAIPLLRSRVSRRGVRRRWWCAPLSGRQSEVIAETVATPLEEAITASRT